MITPQVDNGVSTCPLRPNARFQQPTIVVTTYVASKATGKVLHFTPPTAPSRFNSNALVDSKMQRQDQEMTNEVAEGARTMEVIQLS